MNVPMLEVLSQGEEIVTGQVVDTNSAWLSQQVVTLGFHVTRHMAVGDKLGDLIEVFKDISQRADCCICTGGLGPTGDDLTAEAVSAAFNVPLKFDDQALLQIESYFAMRKRKMAECNRKQAMLPEGAVRLDNNCGTAPGFALQVGRCWFAFLPGVPSEMRAMFSTQVLPLLNARFQLHPFALVTLRTTGIGESDLQERIAHLPMPEGVQLGFRAEIGEVQVKLLFPPDYPAQARTQFTTKMAETIGDPVYAIDSPEQSAGDLTSVIDRVMQDRRLTLSIVETVSHGLLAAKLLGKGWLLSACYERDLVRLAVSLAIETHAKDWLTVGLELAAAISKQTGSDAVLIQIDRSALASNDHEEAGQVLSIFYLDGEKSYHIRILTGERQRRQQQASALGLDLMRRFLQGKRPE